MFIVTFTNFSYVITNLLREKMADTLIVSDTRTRKYHPLTYRQIHTSKRHIFIDIHSSHTQYHSGTNSL